MTPERLSLIALPAALLTLGLLARLTAERAWKAFIGYETPFALDNAGAPASEPLVEQIMILLVDGLGLEASQGMPFLNKLRQGGGDAECRAGQPSLSLPGRAVIVSGAWQEIHGQVSNFNPRPLRVEHLFRVAKRSGLKTALSAGANVHRLLAPDVEEAIVYPRSPPNEKPELARLQAKLAWMGQEGRELLARAEPRLFMIDLTIMDEAGHEWGAASDPYRTAAGLVDEEVRRFAEQMDLTRSVLLVTADHGHLPQGGHGGGEEAALRVPLVLAGDKVRPHSRTQAAQIDIAPTVALLLGTSIPGSNQGRPLLELLSPDESEEDAALRGLCAQRERFVAHYLAWVSGGKPSAAAPLAAADNTAETKRLEDRLAVLERTAEAARRRRLDEERKARLLPAVAILSVPLLFLAALPWLRIGPRGERWLALVGGFTAVALYAAIFRLLGLGYSLSVVNKEEALGVFFLKDMASGVAACAIVVFGRAWGVRRRRREAGFQDLAGLAWLTAAVFCSFFLVKMGVVYFRQGIFLRWALSDTYWGFGFYLDLLVVMAVGVAALILPAFAWLGGRLASSAPFAAPVGKEGS